jgi:hypothetical protein
MELLRQRREGSLAWPRQLDGHASPRVTEREGAGGLAIENEADVVNVPVSVAKPSEPKLPAPWRW